MKRTAKDDQRKREMIGVVLFALAIFVAVSVYSGVTGPVGEWIAGFVFGLFGVFAYISPMFIAFVGVLLIAANGKHVHSGKAALVGGILLLLGAFVHLFAYDYLTEHTFVGYVWGSFKLGETARTGGGLFGGLLSFLAAILLGKAGSMILFGTGMLVCLLVLTNISIKKTGEQLGVAFKETHENFRVRREERARERELYLESIERAEAAAPSGTRKVKSSGGGVDVLPQSGPIKKRDMTHESYPFDLFGDEAKETYDGPDIDELPSSLAHDFGETQYKPARRARHTPDELPWEPDELPFAPRSARPEAEFAPRQAPILRLVDDEAQDDIAGIVEAAPAPRAEKELSMPASVVEHATMPYRAPPISLLQGVQRGGKKTEDPRETAQLLIDTLASFGISATVTDITVGPIITRFELQPALGVRVNRITNLSDDIALRLAAHRVRIEAPIPGKAAIGIEIPNKEKASVLLREVLESKEFKSAESNLTVALGKDIAGKVQVADLSKMPHLLIAGQTGAGKSVCINDIIISLVYKSSPDEVRMILIDPKVVEFQVYETLPHLLVPVVTDPSKAAGALKWAVQEMVRRYQEFAKLGARDIARYNELTIANGEERTPQIVIIVDELADLMMVAPDDVEDGICRLAQMGRAAGLHLVVATQRPSADVITGLIKANIPSRIALAVASATDSRIVLDQGGAEKLLGRGDMLFHPSGTSKPVRAQCAWVSDQEAEAIREYFQQHSMQAQFDSSITSSIAAGVPAQGEGGEQLQFEDELLPKAAEIAVDGGQVSTSMLQRRLRIGYSRAGRLVDILEDMGVISPAEGSKPRKVLITRLQYEQLFGPGDIPAGAYDERAND